MFCANEGAMGGVSALLQNSSSLLRNKETLANFYLFQDIKELYDYVCGQTNVKKIIIKNFFLADAFSQKENPSCKKSTDEKHWWKNCGFFNWILNVHSDWMARCKLSFLIDWHFFWDGTQFHRKKASPILFFAIKCFCLSGLPMSTATSQMVMVIPRALTGSPLELTAWKGARKGMMLSLEMAWSSLGAPVRDWSPAPMVESREPTSTTLGWGHAMLPTTREPPILSPNLDRTKKKKIK